MMYLYIAIALLVGLLLGKALFGKKAAPAPAPAPVAAVPAAPHRQAPRPFRMTDSPLPKPAHTSRIGSPPAIAWLHRRS